MGEWEENEMVIQELECALETEDEGQKDFHVRQALQLLLLDGEDDLDLKTE